MSRRFLIAAVVILVVLAGAGGVLYAFGTPQVPAPDPNAPLAVEIPGCVCHSDDPQLVEEHATYRMNQCAGCHAGGVPTGR